MKSKNWKYPLVMMGVLLMLTNNNTFGQESRKTVTDIDGNVYNTITIGTQTWMKVNLKTTKYNDGTAIQLVTNDTIWSNLTTPGYCWYNNDENTYKNQYGALYNLFVVNTGKLCPLGWHIPTDTEWEKLETYLGGDSVAGNKLKEKDTTHWARSNIDATNESGFTALPGGLRRYDDGSFDYIGYDGWWWSISEVGVSYSWIRILYFASGEVTRHKSKGKFSEANGFSVRCLKD